jgi:hypothetical protein
MHDHEQRLVVNLVNDSVRTSASRPHARELPLQLAADSVWVVGQGANHELDDGDSNATGKPIKLPFCWPRNAQCVGALGKLHFFRYFARRSAAVT